MASLRPVQAVTHVAEVGLVDREVASKVVIRSTTYAQRDVPRAMCLGY